MSRHDRRLIFSRIQQKHTGKISIIFVKKYWTALLRLFCMSLFKIVHTLLFSFRKSLLNRFRSFFLKICFSFESKTKHKERTTGSKLKRIILSDRDRIEKLSLFKNINIFLYIYPIFRE